MTGRPHSTESYPDRLTDPSLADVASPTGTGNGAELVVEEMTAW
jgi:hypothetical protein